MTPHYVAMVDHTVVVGRFGAVRIQETKVLNGQETVLSLMNWALQYSPNPQLLIVRETHE